MKSYLHIVLAAVALALGAGLAGCGGQAPTAPSLPPVSPPAAAPAAPSAPSAPSGPDSQPESMAGGGALRLKVDPDLEICFDAQGLVTEVTGRNDSGRALVPDDQPYQGRECRQVVEELIEALDQAGYLSQDLYGRPCPVTLEVRQGSALPQPEFLSDIAAGVQETLEQASLRNPLWIWSGAEHGWTDYGDTDYGPYSDGWTDYGSTDYGPYGDGWTDYGSTDYGPYGDGWTDYGSTDYGPYGDGRTDYGSTDYGPDSDGWTDYSDTDYGPYHHYYSHHSHGHHWAR